MYGRVGSDAGRLVELGWVGPGSSLQQPSTLWGVFVLVYLSLYFVFVNHSLNSPEFTDGVPYFNPKTLILGLNRKVRRITEFRGWQKMAGFRQTQKCL